MIQITSKIKTSSRQERRAVMDQLRATAGTSAVDIPVSASLAMKEDFNIFPGANCE